MRHSSVLAVLIAVIALVPLTASATTSRSDARTAWDRISGPTQPSVQLGLARTKDGVLHAISNSNAHVRCSFLGRSTDGRSGSDLRRRRSRQHSAFSRMSAPSSGPSAPAPNCSASRRDRRLQP